jgi:DnaD/phage-associated family protein
MVKGFFCMNRTIFNSDIWENVLDFRLYFFLYGNCNFKDIEYKGMIIKRGQWLRSLRQLQKDLTYKENNAMKTPSMSSIQRSIRRLELGHLIKCKKLELGSLFTVLQYETGQGFEESNIIELGSELGSVSAEAWVKNNNDLIKNNDLNKEKKKIQPANIHDLFYLSYGRLPTPIQLQKLYSYIEDGLEDGAILYAIEKASVVSGHFNYLTTILNDWIKKDLKTVERIKEKEKERERGKSHERTRQDSTGAKIAENGNYDFGF